MGPCACLIVWTAESRRTSETAEEGGMSRVGTHRVWGRVRPLYPSHLICRVLFFYQIRDLVGFEALTRTHLVSCPTHEAAPRRWCACMCCLQDSRFHRVHMMCVVCMHGRMDSVVHSSWKCDYWLDIGILRIGLELRTCPRVCGYGFATPRPALTSGSNFLPNPPHLRRVPRRVCRFRGPIAIRRDEGISSGSHFRHRFGLFGLATDRRVTLFVWGGLRPAIRQFRVF
jgi:hypothetical protein